MRWKNGMGRNWVFVACAVALISWTAPATAAEGYVQKNLVSNVPGLAPVTDPSLVNPWGMTSSASSPWWVSDNGTGVATLYNGNTGAKQALTVTVPTQALGTPPSHPTGVVFNNTSGFALTGPGGNGNKASFLFSTEDGVIAGWNSGTSAIRMADLS